MSYEDYTFVFPKKGLISICGDIGSGKSAMLESINYILYGISKVSAKKLVKINNNETEAMYCQLTIQFKDSEYIIKRGIRKSDKGYLDVKLNDEPVASGRNAQKYIDDLLGMNSSIFSLTSFFGAGDSDTLINALPSTRLEAAQEIVNVSPFLKFYNDVKSRRKKQENEMSTLKQIIKVKRENVPNDREINTGISNDQKELDNVIENNNSAVDKKKKILIEIEKVASLITEKEKLNIEIKTLRDERNTAVIAINNHDKNLNKRKSRLTILIKEREDIQSEINNCEDMNKLQKQEKDILNKLSTLNANLNIYQSGLSVDVNHDCPLCDNKIDDSVKNKWSMQSDLIQKKINLFSIDLKNIRKTINKLHTFQTDLGNLNSEIQEYNTEIENLNKEIRKNRKIKTTNDTLINNRKERIITIDCDLKESANAKERLKEVESTIESYQLRRGELESNIKHYKLQLEEREKALLKIERDEQSIKKMFDKFEALNLLCDGFSRYGIPFDLLEGLKRRISKEASKLYNYFSDGMIKVIDLESRGKPGISYVLIDGVGERDYGVLSTGQKTLVGFCIRLSVAFILRGALNINSNLLILDEIAGNLDPKKRVALVKIITGFLKNYFGQIFVTSHAYLKDIFTDTFIISIDNGKSVVKKI